MIIFLYGPDDFRREQRKKFYIEEFKKKYSDLSIGYFDLAEDGKLDELEAFLRGQSLFEKKKLAVVENLYEAEEKGVANVLRQFSAANPGPTVAKKATVEREVNLGASGKQDRTIILCSESRKPPKALAFLSEEPSKAEEFENLEGAAWRAFIKKEAEKLEAKLDRDALEFLAEVYQKNTWGLMTELEKISNLPRKEVQRADLEMLGLETLPNYWMMINSAKSQNLKTRLWALEELLAQKEPPAKIFNILASLWREKIPAMAEYDFMVKSGKLEYEEALVDVVL